jgi:hypothetical protein
MMYGNKRTKARAACQDGGFGSKIQEVKKVGSAPDNAFLIEEVVDDFDAVPHLNLGLFRHRENGAYQLA